MKKFSNILRRIRDQRTKHLRINHPNQMKKIFFLLGFVFLATMFSFAQTGDDLKGGTNRIDAIKIAYLTKELELSPDEAKAFWPLYDRYTGEIKSTLKDSKDDDVLVRQQ